MTGYKLPPTATQFKPGQSGNPKGRILTAFYYFFVGTVLPIYFYLYTAKP